MSGCKNNIIPAQRALLFWWDCVESWIGRLNNVLELSRPLLYRARRWWVWLWVGRMTDECGWEPLHYDCVSTKLLCSSIVPACRPAGLQLAHGWLWCTRARSTPKFNDLAHFVNWPISFVTFSFFLLVFISPPPLYFGCFDSELLILKDIPFQ